MTLDPRRKNQNIEVTIHSPESEAGLLVGGDESLVPRKLRNNRQNPCT